MTNTETSQQILSPAQVQLLLWLRVRRLSIVGSVVQSGVLESTDGSHLNHLALFYGGCGDRATKLYKFLQSSVNLTFLQCTDFCNNNMLEIIAATCGRLHCLELRGCDVTDEGILRLCGLQPNLKECIQILSTGGQILPTSLCSFALKEIKLTMTKVTEAGVAIILLVLRNIELLRVPDIRMEQVFNFLQTLDHKDVQFNLKEFHSREILDEFQLKVLTELCPNLEYIQVSFVGNSEMDVSRLQQLTHLTKLRRAKFADVSIDALIRYLEVSGRYMEHLHLYTYHTIFSQEKLSINRQHVQGIARFCPQLESFCLEGYCLGEEDTSVHRPLSTNIAFFHNLHTLQLLSIKLSEEDLLVFLLRCTKMRILELVLHNPHVIHDKLICDLLDAGVWDNLVKIRILNSPITCKVMDRLVNECPNLQVLGCLYTWLVSKQQVAEFKKTVRHQNLNIEIY